MVANIVGRAVQGEDFFDRVEELQKLKEEGLRQHLLLLAPRRVGKTSLLHRLATVTREAAGWSAAYCSVEDAADEVGFLRSLTEALEAIPAAKPSVKKLRKGRLDKILQGIDRVKLGPLEVARSHANDDPLDDALRQMRAALKDLPGHWYLLLDELPLFVLRLLQLDADGARARRFLQWFRRVRQNEVDSVMTLHWVLAGSIGLDTVAERYALTDTINDLQIVRLGPFTEPTAHAFLQALSLHHKVTLSEDVARAICARVGWLIPHHLQALFSELRAIHREAGCTLTLDDVGTAFSRLLDQSLHFDFWQQRLDKELGAQRARRARDLLGYCAQDPNGATTTTLELLLGKELQDTADRARELRWLLKVLKSDGYLREEGERWVFRSHLLREYWMRKYA
ncbi:MAG: ATP-binding protein [Deltaproteobacteria bacterium]|nr:ATP-binding protein [Deltaproteobacteria bacterium]